MTTKDIAVIFSRYGTLSATVKATGLSFGVVRKALITEGLYTSPITDEIVALHNNGLSRTEIAERLHRSVSSVDAHLPYSKGTYLDENKSKNAIRIKESREKRK